MDAGKIEARKMKENSGDHQHTSLSAGIEDFCETFERTVKPVVVSVTRTLQFHSLCRGYM